MTTFEKLQQPELFPMESNGHASSAAASPAKTSALPGEAQDLRGSVAASGLISLELLATYDQTSCSWKTFQHSLVEDLELFSETWPRWGMIRRGAAYRLTDLEGCKRETVSGLLPTICKSEPRDSSKASILARMDKGGRVARRICSLSPTLRLSEEIVTLNPCFAEWLGGFPIGWTELEQ